VFLENELVYGRSFDVPVLDDYVLPIGKARIVRRAADVTLVSYSIGVGLALEAAETLAADGIDAEVIDLRTLRPLDTGDGAGKPQKDQPPRGGGRRLAGLLDRERDHGRGAWSRALTISMPRSSASPTKTCRCPMRRTLRKAALIDAARVVAAAKKVCYKG
jgi:pyruvate dehydrogenase E1 component beta subunit